MDKVWPFRHLKGQFDLSNWLITAGHVALRVEVFFFFFFSKLDPFCYIQYIEIYRILRKFVM